MSELLNYHNSAVVLFWYYILISAIGAMPTPDEAGSKFYKWLFGFLHLLAGNAARIPQVRALVGLQENPTTQQGIQAQEAAKAVDPSVQGITKKP
jgi:hypothetical protein